MTVDQRIGRGEAPYAALWQFPDGPRTQAYIEDQLGAWLREKGIDVDLHETAVHRFGENRLFIARHESRGEPEFQARLIEHNAAGVWRTELTTRTPGRGPGWLRLRVMSDRGAYVAPPRLAQYLLETGEFRDGGSLELTRHPVVVTSANVQAVAEVITDFSREGLVFVAGTDEDLAFDPFHHMLTDWTSDAVGLAEVYILNPQATQEMTEILGELHAVAPWTIRTFLPDVDPAVDDNARLHRWLSTNRLVDWPKKRVQRTLGRVARGHADSRPLPDNVMHSLRAFVRVENQLLVDSVSAADDLESRLDAAVHMVHVTRDDSAPVAELGPAVAAEDLEPSTPAHDAAEEATQYLRSLELVRQVLGVPEVTEKSLRAFMASLTTRQQETREELSRRLSEQEDEIARLSDDLADSRLLLEDAEIDMAILQEERDDLADTEQWLRRQFAQTPQAYLTSQPIPAEERTTYPASFAELLDWLAEDRVPLVQYTGDPKEIVVLDLHSGMDVALRTAYDVVVVLRDYARMKSGGWSGSVDSYLRTPPDGCRGVGIKRHAPIESETTMKNPRLKKSRSFSMPHKDGGFESVPMFAHFKLGLVGSISPRLHYLDDTAKSGRVYIGYIGKHLENTKTN